MIKPHKYDNNGIHSHRYPIDLQIWSKRLKGGGGGGGGAREEK